jgi:Protein of unknown function (DUF3565)
LNLKLETLKFPNAMKRKIINFDQDDKGDWRAELDCGHFQHVRHDPPLNSRPWVLTEAGRREKLGAELDCKKCVAEVSGD